MRAAKPTLPASRRSYKNGSSCAFYGPPKRGLYVVAVACCCACSASSSDVVGRRHRYLSLSLLTSHHAPFLKKKKKNHHGPRLSSLNARVWMWRLMNWSTAEEEGTANITLRPCLKSCGCNAVSFWLSASVKCVTSHLQLQALLSVSKTRQLLSERYKLNFRRY